MWVTKMRVSLRLKGGALSNVVHNSTTSSVRSPVSTSANPGGQPPAYSRAELDPTLLEAIDAVLAGETGGLARPTPIRNALDGSVLRD